MSYDPVKIAHLANLHARVGELRAALADTSDERYRLVEELIADGMAQGAIARHLGITTQAVGDLRRRGSRRADPRNRVGTASPATEG